MNPSRAPRQRPTMAFVIATTIGISIASGQSAASTGDKIHAAREYLQAGDFGFRAGTLFNIHHHQDTPEGDKGLGLGFVELKYQTPEQAGVRFGGLWYGFAKLWERHAGDFDACCVKQQDLRELYALWTPGTVSIQAGRFRMRMSGLDGHSHQGVQVKGEPVPGIDLRAAVIHRWIDNDLIMLNYKGMSGWRNVEDGAHAGTGREVWLASARLGDDDANVQGFVLHQDGRMSLHGMDAAFSRTLANGRTLGLEGTLTRYGNRTPKDVQPDYEDVWSWIVRASYRRDALTLGLGWYGVSDHRGDLGAGIFDWIDPMTVDEIMPYDDRNNAQLFFADAEIALATLRLEIRYGYGINKALDVKSHELNLIAHYELTQRLRLGSLVAYNHYSGDLLPQHTRAGLLLSYSH